MRTVLGIRGRAGAFVFRYRRQTRLRIADGSADHVQEHRFAERITEES